MMKRPWGSCVKKIIAFLLVLCFCIPAAKAEGGASLAPMLGGWLTRVRDGEAADITVSATLHALAPYGVETLAAMNRLLSKCKVQVGYQQSKQGEYTQTRLIIGDMHAVDFRELSGDQALAQTSLLPGMTLSSTKDSPIRFLLGEVAEIPFWAGGIPDPNVLSRMIPDVLNGLAAFAQEKQVSYRIASVGTAQKALVYTVPKESTQILKDGFSLILGGLDLTEAAAFLRTLTIGGDTVITLYQSSEGVNMALGVKAVMGFENVTPRIVTFLWGFSSSEKKNVHTISLKAPAQNGPDNLTAAGEMALQYLEGKNSLSFSLDIRSRQGNRSERTKWTGELDCLLAEDNQRLEGEIRQAYTDPEGMDHTLSVRPSLLALSVGNDFSVKGNVRIGWIANKSAQADVEFSVLACNAGDLRWEDTKDTVLLDGLKEDERNAMAEKAQTAAAEAIWRAVLLLPPEYLTLISQNISQEDWERIYHNTYRVGQ